MGFFFLLVVLQKMKRRMMMMRRRTTRRKRRRLMWWQWRRGRRWSGATRAQQRRGIPARSCSRGATSPPISITTPPIRQWGTSSRRSRGWSWRAVEAARAVYSSRSAPIANAQAPGRLTRRTMTREGLIMYLSARGGTSSSWASSLCGMRFPKWPTTKRQPKWWSLRRLQSAFTVCSRMNRDSSHSKSSWLGKVNFWSRDSHSCRVPVLKVWIIDFWPFVFYASSRLRVVQLLHANAKWFKLFGILFDFNVKTASIEVMSGLNI